jgi:hypothetical protein
VLFHFEVLLRFPKKMENGKIKMKMALLIK